MTNAVRPKPHVFISYAHADSFDFTRRIAFALSLYADVFWDRHLESGPYPEQLYGQIEEREYFLLIMSPFSLRSGGWCEMEIAHAQKCHDQGIMLAKVFPSIAPTDFEKQLVGKYTYADFTEDFEPGFRKLTHMMIKEARSSWEHLALLSTPILLESIQRGEIPGLLLKSLMEWVLIEKLWAGVEDYVQEQKVQHSIPFFKGSPRTPINALEQVPELVRQFALQRNQIGIKLIDDVRPILESYQANLANLPDDHHEEICAVAIQLLAKIYEVAQMQKVMLRQVVEVASIQAYFYSDVADKLRELVNLHARRSRYLY